ncbi:hypothetical protein CL630_01215 [bacterium]|nr:hypothetical protein [bacterium]|tara:strand:+ start:2910 stop:3170 length:261 start_codon:yes stop_codon:yes gene_type:complete
MHESPEQRNSELRLEHLGEAKKESIALELLPLQERAEKLTNLTKKDSILKDIKAARVRLSHDILYPDDELYLNNKILKITLALSKP